MASQALRVLGLAFRENPPFHDGSYPETELVFAGLAGMIDPPRDEVRAAVRTCHTAGIRPVMITGDHPATARAIAHELHLGQLGDAVVTGQELDRMSEEELAGQLEKISVYARVSAEHKLRVVQAWKAQGQVVAMTGDGVNDAPAVKVADIGIAMGVTGTDVTKEASDMVLTDDNFASIVSAVEEGRGIFDNIQKFVHYLLSCNTGEVLFMFVAAAAGWPAPLVAIQLLWINLVTDGLPALALGMEPPERDVMQRRPRPPREPVITLQRGMFMLCHGTLIALASVIGFHVVRHGQADLLPRAQTVAFCIMACSQLFFAFTCRSSRHSLLRLGLLSNSYLIGAVLISGLLQLSVIVVPAFQPVLKTVTLGPMEWGFVLLLSLMPALLVEAVKELRRALYRTTRGGDEQSTD
jgi:Ca2+-transporting ATPase